MTNTRSMAAYTARGLGRHPHRGCERPASGFQSCEVSRSQKEMGFYLGSLLFAALHVALGTAVRPQQPQQLCVSNKKGGTNIVVTGAEARTTENVSSAGLPPLPRGTISIGDGVYKSCGFDGTIVVGGALSLAAVDEKYSRSLEMFQSAVLFVGTLQTFRT